MKKILALCLVFYGLVSGSTRAVDYPTPTGTTTARTFPYSMIGSLDFLSGPDAFVASGTVIRRRSVLTAAHNLWDPQAGWSTQIQFTRSPYDDSGLSQQYASRKYILGGYAGAAHFFGADTDIAFANDMGGLIFTQPPADGAYAGWWPNPAALTGETYNIALGYGAENHSGDELLSMTPNVGFFRSYRAFFENDSIAIEGGMSGGPVFAQYGGNGQFYVVAVLVAGSDDPVSTGVRVIDARAAAFIRLYLR